MDEVYQVAVLWARRFGSHCRLVLLVLTGHWSRRKKLILGPNCPGFLTTICLICLFGEELGLRNFVLVACIVGKLKGLYFRQERTAIFFSRVVHTWGYEFVIVIGIVVRMVRWRVLLKCRPQQFIHCHRSLVAVACLRLDAWLQGYEQSGNKIQKIVGTMVQVIHTPQRCSWSTSMHSGRPGR